LILISTLRQQFAYLFTLSHTRHYQLRLHVRPRSKSGTGMGYLIKI